MNKPTITNVIIAGLFTILGTALGSFLSHVSQTDIRKKEFEYGLIKEAMALDDSSSRVDRLKLYLSTGLIESIQTDSLIYRINYHHAYRRGREDARAQREITGALSQYIQAYGKAPVDLEELKLKFPVSVSLNHFKDKVYYVAWAPNQLILRLPYRDGLIFTRDDKIYRYADLVEVDQN